NDESSYSSMKRYGETKLANILMVKELQRRLEAKHGKEFPVYCNSLHPGIVATELSRYMVPDFLKGTAAFINRTLFLTPEQGAISSVYLATSRDVMPRTSRIPVSPLLTATRVPSVPPFTSPFVEDPLEEEKRLAWDVDLAGLTTKIGKRRSRGDLRVLAEGDDGDSARNGEQQRPGSASASAAENAQDGSEGKPFTAVQKKLSASASQLKRRSSAGDWGLDAPKSAGSRWRRDVDAHARVDVWTPDSRGSTPHGGGTPERLTSEDQARIENEVAKTEVVPYYASIRRDNEGDRTCGLAVNSEIDHLTSTATQVESETERDRKKVSGSSGSQLTPSTSNTGPPNLRATQPPVPGRSLDLSYGKQSHLRSKILSHEVSLLNSILSRTSSGTAVTPPLEMLHFSNNQLRVLPERELSKLARNLKCLDLSWNLLEEIGEGLWSCLGKLEVFE
ncbi:hypothetical protein HDU93_009332, partial [Gonapodya sp. JEL0774]